MVKIEDIIFWIAIIIIIGIAIWKLFGSPTDTAALISITLFMAMSELALWRKVYTIEIRTAVGFTKVRADLNLIKNDLSYIKRDLDNINNRLNNIKNLVKKR